MTYRTWRILAACTAVLLNYSNPASGASPLSVTAPCEATEHWYFNDSIPEEVRNEFAALISGKASAAKSLSEALAFRKDSASEESRAFSEYWIARSLFSAGLAHSAYAGFVSIVMREHSLPVSLAALRCISSLVLKFPTLELPEGLTARLSEFPDRKTTAEAALLLFGQQINRKSPPEELKRTLALLRNTGPSEHFAQGIWAAHQGDHRAAASSLEKFLATGVYSPLLANNVDRAHLLAARAYYSMKDFAKASSHFRKISKSSNDLPEALSELSWSSLGAKAYGEAIGASINLQSGGLRRVFSPEGPMVLAMALNELCQFPEALRAISQFRKDYEPSYLWLSSWARKPPQERENLHNLAIAFLSKKRIPAPERLASEWLRSPVFISSQEQLNLLSDEAAAIRTISRQGANEQKVLGQKLVRLAANVIPRLKTERSSKKPLSLALRNDVTKLAAHLGEYRRLRGAAPVWRALARSQATNASTLRAAAQTRIAGDLSRRNSIMLARLNEIAENNRLIEVEIFDGASQDIIWQNAHPDYREMVKSFADEYNRVANARVWMWGRGPIDSREWSEVWEDELGALKSNLFNNCSNKEKYLAVKARKMDQASGPRSAGEKS